MFLAMAVVVALVAAAFVALARNGSEKSSPSDTTAARGGTVEAPVPSNPYDAAYGTFQPLTLTGSGPATIPLPAGGRKAGIFSWRSADSSFRAVLRADDGERIHLSNFWSSRGSVPYGMVGALPTSIPESSDAVLESFTVRSEGPWTVTIAPVSSARELPVAGTSGTGPRTFLHSGAAGTWLISYHARPRLWDGISVLQWPLESGQTIASVGLEPYAPSQPLHLKSGPSVVLIEAWTRWAISAE